MTASGRYALRTYGCQMNVHDSEKVANLLHHHGFAAADGEDAADLLLINTCSIREKAEHRLYSDLGLLRGWKRAAPGRVLGVGGCVAQQEGDALLARFPHLDLVYGTHNLRWVPEMVAAARRGHRCARVEESRSLERFDWPERHPDFAPATPGRAFVTVMEGCDMFCAFCVVPHTRGREISRPAASIEAEVASLAARGVREITLLGQTVNAYGRHDARRASARSARAASGTRAEAGSPGGRSGESGTVPFPALVRRLAQTPGIDRIRYTSPHPIFFDDDLCRAHGELPSLCPHVHLPLQSGSDAVLARMRRRHTRDDFRRLVDRLRRHRPDVALTTDLIVGFPGESDRDFEDTLSLVREVAFVDGFSFRYSPRPETAAARASDAVPEAVAQERLTALQALLRRLTLEAHRARVGSETAVRVEGESRRGGGQQAGRDPYHRVVNFTAPAGAGPPPGALVPVRIVEATPHSLIGEPIEGPAARPSRAA